MLGLLDYGQQTQHNPTYFVAPYSLFTLLIAPQNPNLTFHYVNIKNELAGRPTKLMVLDIKKLLSGTIPDNKLFIFFNTKSEENFNFLM